MNPSSCSVNFIFFQIMKSGGKVRPQWAGGGEGGGVSNFRKEYLEKHILLKNQLARKSFNLCESIIRLDIFKFVHLMIPICRVGLKFGSQIFTLILWQKIGILFMKDIFYYISLIFRIYIRKADFIMTSVAQCAMWPMVLLF